MQYTIERGRFNGMRLCVGRIPRKHIDRLDPRPEPPEVSAASLGVEVWGDPDARVINRRDPGYLAELQCWSFAHNSRLLNTIAPAVEIVGGMPAGIVRELEDLRANVGYSAGSDIADFLRYLAGERDLDGIVDAVFYQSTVTMRGIAEAARRFGVKVDGRPVDPAYRGRDGYSAMGEFRDRQAARWAGYTWPEFAALDGPEQSATVAHYLLVMKVRG